MASDDVDLIRERCQEPEDAELAPLGGGHASCPRCRGTEFVYRLDGEDWRTRFVLADCLNYLADDTALPERLDEQVRQLAEDLEVSVFDDAADAAERRAEDQAWDAGCAPRPSM